MQRILVRLQLQFLGPPAARCCQVPVQLPLVLHPRQVYRQAQHLPAAILAAAD